MGKKRKFANSGDLKTNKSFKNKKIKVIDNADSKEVQECDPDQSGTSKIKNIENKEVLTKESDPLEINTSTKTLRKKKRNKIHVVDDLEKSEELNDNDEVAESNSESLELIASAKNSKKNKINSKSQNKKITFTDDEPVEIQDQTNKRKRSKNTELSQEEDVKDEDIDKFCNEITEEDNVQYENWVQLIEAKLNNNKNKPK